MTPLYIIPARGGSKGIPRKNIRLLGDKPLIAYAIEAAKSAQAHSGGYVMLSTDDAEIAAVAASCGLETEYMRPAELATDTSGSREFMLHAMDWAREHGVRFDCVVLLQPTSPLRSAKHILEAMELYTEDCDMVVSVTTAPCNPYYDLFEEQPDGTLRVCKGDGLYTRRQDVPPVFLYNGAVYVINPSSLRAMPMGAFPRRIPYYMAPELSIDLDTPDDWSRAEQIMNATDTKE